MDTDNQKDKSSLKSPATNWEQTIKEIPIPQNKKDAKFLVLTGFLLLVITTASFLFYAANASINTTGGSVQSWIALLAFGSALTGLAMMLRGIWFFFASTRLCKGLLIIAVKYKALPWWQKVICGFVFIATAATWLVWLARIPDTFLSSLMSWLRLGSFGVALGLALAGVVMTLGGIRFFTTSTAVYKNLQLVVKKADALPSWVKLILAICLVGSVVGVALFLFSVLVRWSS